MTVVTEILNADALLKQAQEETGLTDWGDETLPERFHLVVEFIRRAGMDEAGQRAGASTCLWLLTSRLRFFEDFKRYPIGQEKIEQPIFVTGEARAGTTFLQAVLSVDPNGRAMRFWELMYPSPPPGLARADDPRRAQADDDWRELNKKMPKWLISHPYNDMLGNNIPECHRVCAFDFRNMVHTTWWRVPMQAISTGLPVDHSAEYRIHKMWLQYCQYARSKKYWVLKGFHGGRLPALFETYPDARIIWVHRDPVQVIASSITFAADLNEERAGYVDRQALADGLLKMSRANYRAILNNPMVDDPRIHHVRYRDLVRDPAGTIKGFYERYGLPFGSEYESAIREYLQNNKSDRYGKFQYSTDCIGADIAELHEEFAPYRERFGLEIEQRK